MTKTHIARYACQMSMTFSQPDNYRDTQFPLFTKLHRTEFAHCGKINC